jgi:tetratricopeptide (TPR) repeat protein
MREVNTKELIEDRVNIILDELSLGIQWERPSILLLVYRSEYIKTNVQTILAQTLRESGQLIYYYSVDKEHYDIPLELLNHPKHEKAVYFVSGVRWGGGRGYSNAYRALNMHREYLVEGNIKTIFWFTIHEGNQVARFAPDFWAFRHKVIEFPDLPAPDPNQASRCSDRTDRKLFTESPNELKILIKKAEESVELGCMEEAIQNYQKALRKYPDQAAILLPMAEIYLSMGMRPAACRILRKAILRKTRLGPVLKELERLNRIADSIQIKIGGFSEQSAEFI